MKIATFKVWWIFLLLFMACSGGENEPVEPVVPETPVVTPPQPEKVDTLKQEPIPKGEGYAWDIARKLGLGWNLGNQMDAHDKGVANETCWGNQPATQQTFNKLAEAGITIQYNRSVLLPAAEGAFTVRVVVFAVCRDDLGFLRSAFADEDALTVLSAVRSKNDLPLGAERTSMFGNLLRAGCEEKDEYQ